jgi:hypothetical protein
VARGGRTRAVTAGQARRYLARPKSMPTRHRANSTQDEILLRPVWPSMLPMPYAVFVWGSELPVRITIRCSYC